MTRRTARRRSSASSARSIAARWSIPTSWWRRFEGGIGFGLGAALQNKIELIDGIVQQSNFDDYQPLRISQMPTIEIYLIHSTEPPGGVGEPPVPCVAPALANAIFSANGERLRQLPLLDKGSL